MNYSPLNSHKLLHRRTLLERSFNLKYQTFCGNNFFQHHVIMKINDSHKSSKKKLGQQIYLIQFMVSILGVPATSRVLAGDSQKPSFSTLTKVPYLIFDQTNPVKAKLLPRQPVAEMVHGLRGQKLSINQVCLIMIKFTFLKSSCSKYLSPSQIG